MINFIDTTNLVIILNDYSTEQAMEQSFSLTKK